MKFQTNLSKAHCVLRQLGINANYRGFFHVTYAIALTIENPDYLTLITKWLYIDVAHFYHTTAQAVERNIRTIIETAWKRNPEYLEELAHYPLEQKPSNAQFIAIIAQYIAEDNWPCFHHKPTL